MEIQFVYANCVFLRLPITTALNAVRSVDLCVVVLRLEPCYVGVISFLYSFKNQIIMSKTIEEAKKEAYFSDQLMSDMRLQSIENAHGAGFIKGIEFSKQWISIFESHPAQGAFILLKTKSGHIFTSALERRGFVNLEKNNYVDLTEIEYWSPIFL